LLKNQSFFFVEFTNFTLKKMRHSFLFLILISSLVSCSQDYKIEGIVDNYQNRSLYITGFYGDQNKIVDSVKTNTNGLFEFHFNKNKASGMYRLMLDNGEFFDFIFNKENIKLFTTSQNALQNCTAIESLENEIYFTYLEKRNKSLYKLDLIRPVILYFPECNAYVENSIQEFTNVQDGLYHFIDSLAINFGSAYATRIALSERGPVVDPVWTTFEENVFMRQHFFDHIDFSDTSLLRTNVLANKIIGYLSLYQNKNFNKEQLQNAFKTAVDSILKVSQPYPLVYEFSLDYLIKGFERFGFNELIEYIAENALLNEDCEYSDSKSKLEQRIETLKKLSIGKTAPDFSVIDINSKPIILSEINAEKTLLVFWATWCPHCTNVIPELSRFKTDGIDLKIISVSVDSSKTDYTNFLKTGEYGEWINVCEFNGWDNSIAELYGIYATPTMILLDKNRKIIGKPNDINELKILLKN
jgi:thiol-disulfide isomerase/thioredoxin